jgi:hypothetical protein
MITAQMVKEAYEKTGLKPVQKYYVHNGCVCGLTALVAARSSIDKVRALNHQGLRWETFANILDIPVEFVAGFIHAYDEDFDPPEVSTPEYFKGYVVGEEARKLVFGE